ncbi:ribosomal RNA processing protein 36 homolog [Plutella xylostella]|uniref:ribosomal RNA processing protein 36 homolog n=1 Tax=Plutella xylostella TaxID=51655 RepID=UPI0020327B83|nr:ribosomal RNA processing protein 36 homolog [Plutella xylostella]
MSSSDDDGSEENAPIREEMDDGERTAIRAELSTLSFEELQKLKEKIGAKVYKEALFGSNKKEKDEKPKVFKRENKNRPREMSSKKPVSMIREVPTKIVHKKEVRDPRFDSLCGEFDKKQFSQDYSFLSDLRLNDIKSIRAELKQTDDPEREIKLRRLLQRLTEQHRATKRGKMEIEKKKLEKDFVEKEFKEGKQPYFKNKTEQKVEALVKQYEELKKEGAGRVQRHLKRRQQKVKKKTVRPPASVS